MDEEEKLAFDLLNSGGQVGMLDESNSEAELAFDIPKTRPNQLKTSSFQAKSADYKRQAEEAERNSLDLLKEALNNKTEISPSQGMAAALLALIPTLGGVAIGKAVGKPNIPEGTYFPGMGAKEFSQTFGFGGNAAAAQGAGIGAMSAQDYLGRIDKENAAETPILKDMADAEKRKAEMLTQKAAALDTAEITQGAIDERQRRSQEFQREERVARQSQASQLLGSKNAWKQGLTQEQIIAAERAQRGLDPQGNIKPDLTAEANNEIRKRRSLADKADYAAKLVSQFSNWGELQAARISGFDVNQARAAVLDFVDETGRIRSGSALREDEARNIEKFASGDFSAPPELVSKFLSQMAARERFSAASTFTNATALSSPEGRQAIASAQQSPGVVPLMPNEDERKKRLDRINAIMGGAK